MDAVSTRRNCDITSVIDQHPSRRTANDSHGVRNQFEQHASRQRLFSDLNEADFLLDRQADRL